MTWTLKNEAEYLLGGELDITLEDFLQPEAPSLLPLPGKRDSLYLDTGRSAIYLALCNIIRQGGKREAWLPRYCCPAVELPFLKLGFKLNYYSTGNDLNSPSGLPQKLDGETFFFIHYFGKRNQAIENYLQAMQKKHSFFIIEDCVQALLNRNLGTFDFAVYSFRKFLPQPDGALLSSSFPLHKTDLAPADEAFVSRRLIGKLIRRRSNNTFFLDLFAAAEESINNFTEPREMSFLSFYLLARTNPPEIAAKRRNNFFYLIEAIKQQAYDQELMHPLFASLDPGEVPLGLPLVVNPSYRDRLRRHLAKQSIYCPVHWPLQTTDTVSWESELQLSRSLLTLPLDQKVDCSALNYLLEKLANFFKKVGEKN